MLDFTFLRVCVCGGGGGAIFFFFFFWSWPFAGIFGGSLSKLTFFFFLGGGGGGGSVKNRFAGYCKNQS